MKTFLISCVLIISACNFYMIKTLFDNVKTQQTELRSHTLQLADIQRTVGSFNTIVQPFIDEFDTARIVMFKIQGDSVTAASQPTTDVPGAFSNLSVVVIDAISTHSDDVLPLLTVRPFSIYSFMLPQLINKQIIAYHVTDMPAGPLKEVLMKRDTQFGMWIDITSSDGKLVGILSIGWTNKEKVPTGTDLDRVKKMLRQTSDNLSHNFNRLPSY